MSNAPVEVHEGAQAIAPAAPILPHECTPRDVEHAPYPYAVYPPFRDPDDYRELIGQCAEGVTTKARQLINDAASNHVIRHAAHNHPWCHRCALRVDCWESDHLTHGDSVDALRAVGLHPSDPACVDWLALSREYNQRCSEDGPCPDPYDKDLAFLPEDMPDEWPSDVSAHIQGLTSEQYKAVRDYALSATYDAHPVRIINAQATALRRACRYLVLHGKSPSDPWPNLDTGEADYDAEFLTRDELAELPEADALVGGVLPRNSLGHLIARDHQFKTFVAIDWACSIATGRDWCGQATDPGKVLYIAGEGARGIGPRIAAWEAEHGARVHDEAFVVRKSALNLHAPTPAFDHLLAYIEAGEFDLVVVDTLRRVSGSADGNGSEMGAVIDNLDLIKRATDNGTVLVLAHTTKADTDTRGFSGIEDDADFVWHAKREDMVVEITCTKMKDGADGHSFRLQARQSADSLALIQAGESDRVGVSASATKLLGVFIDVFRDGASGAQLKDASGMAPATFYRALAELVADGHVAKSGTDARPFYRRVDPADFDV